MAFSPPVGSQGDSEDAEARGRFIAQVVFTRQIPLDFSPIERWSLAEIWTVASGTAGSVGLGYVSGTSWPIILITGAFGALLLRPLVAISEGIAAGLKPAVREATEKYARTWLQRTSGSGDLSPGPTQQQDVPTVESEEKEDEARRVRKEHAARESRAQLGREKERIVQNLEGRIGGLEDAARERLADAGLASLFELTEAARLSLDELYDPVATSSREEGVHWDVMPGTLTALRETLDELEPLAQKAGGNGRFHHLQARQLVEMLAQTLEWWRIAER